MIYRNQMIKTLSAFFVLFATFSISIEMFIMVIVCFIAITFLCVSALSFLENEQNYKFYLKKFVKSKCIKDKRKLQKIQSDFENR